MLQRSHCLWITYTETRIQSESSVKLFVCTDKQEFSNPKLIQSPSAGKNTKKMFRLFIVRLICRSYLLCKGSSSSFFTSSVISLFVTVMPVVTSSQLMSGNRTGPHGIFVFEFWFSRLTVRIGRTFLQPKGDDSICIGRTTIEIKNANCFIFLVQLHFYNVPFGK